MQDLDDRGGLKEVLETSRKPALSFSELDLDHRLTRALSDIGFSSCTPIQAETLPLLLNGTDVAGQAQTGTGKTAAYLLAMLNTLLKDDSPKAGFSKGGKSFPRGLVLAPTRELAIQIYNDLELLGKNSDLSYALVYGGIDYETQKIKASQKVDILIGTPGRLIDFFKQGIFSLKNVKTLVLDEADRMFDLGFIKDLRFLLRRVPAPSKRLTMLFSATLSFRVNELAYEHMNNPHTVRIKPDQRIAEKIEQKLYHVASSEKIKLLVGILQGFENVRAIVFVNTKRIGTTLVRYLKANGCHARALSGDVAQDKRQKLIQDFKEGRLDVVVATDVAARGLHIPGVELVINYDLPQNNEDYVHRIGRTARAGASGSAVSFACEEFVFSLEDIEEYIGMKIPVSSVEESLMPDLKVPEKPEHRSLKKKDGFSKKSHSRSKKKL